MSSTAIVSPVHAFLTRLDPSQQQIAFLSFNNGFLPHQPLPLPPPPFDAWTKAAQMLPSFCKSSKWSSFLSALPRLSVTHLQDVHLLSANASLGAIAHAIANIAYLPVPDHVLDPWKQINARLGNPTVSFSTFDLLYYNFDIIPHTLPPPLLLRTEHITDPWSQTVPRVMLTGALTERNFLTSTFGVEAAARPLPFIIASAHNAVLRNDHAALKHQLVRLVKVIEKMIASFVSSDFRPLSSKYLDCVEFNRCVGAVAHPVLPGEKTASGLLNPSFHLLDVFFGRKKYSSQLGVMWKEDRQWFPKLHRDFFEQVEKVDVFEYISTQDHSVHEDLLNIFRRALHTYAGEHGLLGKHRIRISGIIEVGIKVGRPATASGTETPKWQQRPWIMINKLLSSAMQERLQICEENFFVGVVQSCRSSENDDTISLIIDTQGALVYEPGDRISILPENSDSLVREALDVFRMSPDDILEVKQPAWITALAERRIDHFRKTTGGSVQLKAELFFRIATLQPLNSTLGARIADILPITNPALLAFLMEERACNVPIALSIVEDVTNVSPLPILPHIDFVLDPLRPYTYSIASNLKTTPNSVEVVVGKVHYEAKTMLSFKHGRIPWYRKSPLNGEQPLLQDSYNYLRRYVTLCEDAEARENMDANTKVHRPESDESNMNGNKKEARNWTRENTTAMNRTTRSTMKKMCDLLSKPQVHNVKNLTAKAIARSQVVCNIARNTEKPNRVLNGVSSHYLSQRKPGQEILLRVEPELDFHLPDDPNAPIVMFALGTGLAPFRAYLKELINDKSKEGNTNRNAWLVLGIKSPQHIPYKEEVEEAVCKEKVVELSIACSQENADFDMDASEEHLSFQPGTKKRIPGLFEENYMLHEKLWKMITAGAHVYACGRPELEPLVRSIIASAVKRFAGLSNGVDFESSAVEYADRMVAEKRLHIDAYFSGKPIVFNKTFTASQIAEHRTAKSCWVIFHKCVYDISSYLPVHPGGPKLLLDKGGRDMTADFNLAHGTENLRVMSMVTPYKIGYLETFPKSSERIKSFMKQWSLPLMYDVMEHKSVYMLDWNVFPELQEPAAFLEYKSYISSPAGVAGLCERVWTRYEPEIFGVLEKYLRDERLCEMILSLSCDGTTTTGRVNGEIALEQVRSIREEWVSQKRLDGALGGGEAEAFLMQMSAFMETIVEMCVTVQRHVEEGLEQSLRGIGFRDTCTIMIAKVLQTLVDSVADSYKQLPGQQ